MKFVIYLQLCLLSRDGQITNFGKVIFFALVAGESLILKDLVLVTSSTVVFNISFFLIGTQC